MGLIKCKKCGTLVSDKADACPLCGTIVNEDINAKDFASTDDISLEKEYNNKQCTKAHTNTLFQKRLILIIILLTLSVTGVLVYFFTNKSRSINQENTSTEEVSPKEAINEYPKNDKENISKINNISVISSSVLNTQLGNTYYASNILDGLPETAWATKFTGTEEYLIFYLPSSTLKNIVIENGYAKSEQAYKNNARAKDVKIYINDTFISEVKLKDTWQPQSITLNEYSGIANSVKLVISSIYEGYKYNDLCISDISFWGSNSDMISKSSKNVVFKGNIDDKYSIAMNLQIEGSSVKGKYYYTKYDSSNSLRLVGTYSDRTFNLKEYNSDDKYTGAFNGKYEDNIFSGIFINYKGEQMPFKFYSVN